MRKNSPRKILHAILDLLPVILIPVFMIYSHRHEIGGSSIEFPKSISIDYNQIQYNGNFAYGVDGFNFGTNSSYQLFDDYLRLEAIDNDVQGYRFVNTNPRLNYVENHQYVFRFYYSYPATLNRSASFRLNLSSGSYDINNLSYSDGLRSYSKLYSFDTSLSLNIQFVYDGIDYFDITNINIFDLTQMFGVGNEPSLDEFNSYFSDSYYQFNIGHRQLLVIDNYVYDDSDIMSQFTYQLYNAVNKYFNVGNVFNMNGVYDWFNLNIFNGNSPIYIYLIWQIVLYEFLMDLIFLLYGLFMFFVDFCSNLMERFHYKASGGR